MLQDGYLSGTCQIPIQRVSKFHLACQRRKANYAGSAPMRHVVSYESRPFALQSIYLANGTINPVKSNNFNGQPRPELESAWDELMQRT